MTHDQLIIAAAAKRTRDDAEARLEQIGLNASSFMDCLRHMGLHLGMSDSDFERYSDYLEDLESDLFFDEIKQLKLQIETASDIALEDYEDHISNRRKLL